MAHCVDLEQMSLGELVSLSNRIGGERRIRYLKTVATSETSADPNQTNDPWEGSGVGPTRWSQPFYEGHVIRTPEVPLFLCDIG